MSRSHLRKRDSPEGLTPGINYAIKEAGVK